MLQCLQSGGSDTELPRHLQPDADIQQAVQQHFVQHDPTWANMLAGANLLQDAPKFETAPLDNYLLSTEYDAVESTVDSATPP